MFEFINTKNKMARLYNLIYVIRRLTFIMLCIFKNESGGLLLAINMFINLIYGMYMASSKAFRRRSMNRQDIFCEFFVSASIYWKIFYTNLIQKENDKFYFANIEIGLILFYSFINLIIIIFGSA